MHGRQACRKTVSPAPGQQRLGERLSTACVKFRARDCDLPAGRSRSRRRWRRASGSSVCFIPWSSRLIPVSSSMRACTTFTGSWPRGHIPNADATIRGAGRNLVTVGAENHGGLALVAGKRGPDLLSGGQVPQTGEIIAAGHKGAVAIRTDDHAGDSARAIHQVPAQATWGGAGRISAKPLPSRRTVRPSGVNPAGWQRAGALSWLSSSRGALPARDAIVSKGDQRAAVVEEGETSDGPDVGSHCADDLAGRRFVPLERPVRATDHKRRTVGTECEGCCRTLLAGPSGGGETCAGSRGGPCRRRCR